MQKKQQQQVSQFIFLHLKQPKVKPLNNVPTSLLVELKPITACRSIENSQHLSIVASTVKRDEQVTWFSALVIYRVTLCFCLVNKLFVWEFHHVHFSRQ